MRAAVDLFPTTNRIVDTCHQLCAHTLGSDSVDNADAKYGPLLTSIRKFSTLKNIWTKEASTRE